MADTLKALTNSGVLVFKEADIWKHQIAASSGGIEAIDRYAPFAFVAYNGAESAREGDYELRQEIRLSVLIGQVSKADGVCRFGSDIALGTLKIRDLVIAAFDRNHPGAGFNCDDFIYDGEFEIVDSPLRHVIQMNFTINQL